MLTEIKIPKNVCNINAILIVRLMFGQYSCMNKSPTTHLLCKLYCAAFTALLIYTGYIYSTHLQPIFRLSACAEYGIVTLISIRMEDKYLLKYYQHTILDSLPYAKEMYGKLERILKISFIMIFVFRVIIVVLYCASHYHTCLENPSVIVISNILGYARDMSRFPVVMIFSLLFCRVRVLRKTLLTKGFDNSPMHRLTPRRYIQMYEMLVDAISDMDYPLKLMIINNIGCCIPAILLDLYYTIDDIKKNGPSYTDVTWLMFKTIKPLEVLIVAALLLDLMTEDVADMRCFTQEKCMRGASERDRSDIRKLSMVLRERPLHYTILRVVNLTLKEIACFYSFSVTTIIAILQIKSF